jgi:hypothetical protein
VRGYEAAALPILIGVECEWEEAVFAKVGMNITVILYSQFKFFDLSISSSFYHPLQIQSSDQFPPKLLIPHKNMPTFAETSAVKHDPP